MRKNFIIIFVLFFTSCGYVPMYSINNQENFKITILESYGDRDVNNLIKSRLNNYSNINSEKKINLKMNSIYEKNSIAKDTTGNTTDYEVKIETIFIFDLNNEIKEITLSESFNFKSLSSNFEELEYEKTLKENMVRNIVNKFMLQFTRIR